MTEDSNTVDAVLSSFTMTDLEQRLLGEEGPDLRDEILEQLKSKSEQLQSRMDAGLPPDDYEAHEVVLNSFAAAFEIVTYFPVQSKPGG